MIQLNPRPKTFPMFCSLRRRVGAFLPLATAPLLAIGVALLLVSISRLAEAQTFVDRKKPGFVASPSVPPVGWYDSVQSAFAAHKAWRESNYCGYSAVGPSCTISDLQPCANNGTVNWDVPSNWCWREVRTRNGVTEFDGITGTISAIDVCPDGYSKVTKLVSGTGTAANPWVYKNECEVAKPRIAPGECGNGNPIYPASGSKRQVERDFATSDGRLTFTRVYHSDWGLFRNEFDLEFTPPSQQAGAACSMASFSISGKSFPKCFGALNATSTGNKAVFVGADGARLEFNWDGTTGTPAYPYSTDRLTRTTVDGANGWLLARRQENRYLTFDDLGRLVAIQRSGGTRVTISRNGPYLTAIADDLGRTLLVAEDASGLTAVTEPSGSQISYAQDVQRRTIGVTWQDGTQRTYLWDEPTLATGTSSVGSNVNRLTGVVDENGDRFASFGYSAGKAISTEYSGGVNRYAITDNRSSGTGNIVMTVPNSTETTSTYAVAGGSSRPTSHSQPAGAGCSASTSSLSYDTNGNVASKTDFNGTKSCHAYDLSRNLETARLDGLGAADACPADPSAFTIAAEASQRKTTTQWHPAWSLPVKQAEPKKITISVYNGQPDPTAGNATAGCAPTTALLPDGSRIAVLCKKVEQATTDATGSLGFSATTTGAPRTWTYTYNQYGQALTARDPLNKLTTYVYYSDTTDQHTMGDLQSVTDSAGRITQYTRYDKSGRLMQSVDVNGTVTDTTYTPRGWVKTVTVTAPGAAAQASLYDYDGVGQLKKATLPDGSALEYTYDAAHRLTAVKDAAGNSVIYTLDNVGNRTGEELTDPSGTLARSIIRIYDALNRVESASGVAR